MPTPIRRHDTLPVIEAAPFTAHLHHVSATTRLGWPVLALAAGLDLPTAEPVWRGTTPTITEHTAQCLWRLGPDVRSALASSFVAGAPSAYRLRYLLRRGWLPPTLAHHLGLSLDELRSVLSGRRPTVSRLVDLQIEALTLIRRPTLRAA